MSERELSSAEEPLEQYEPPEVEDLDTSEGPAVTAAGVISGF